MTVEQDVEARAERDGCGCPPWIIRCAHFDGEVVALGYKRLWMAQHSADCSLRMSITSNMRLDEWGLYYPKGWEACTYCGASAIGAVERFHIDYFTTEDAALAAFYAAEDTLLRGPIS